jgi:MFS family permease
MTDTPILDNGAELAPPYAATPSRRYRTVAACAIGNALETYDFTVYSFFAVLIGKLFFPSDNEYSSLLLAVATFGIGFLMRPLGAVVIGHYADRKGRKPAMTLTIGLMVAGTLSIAIAPTYASAGILGPMIIVAGRLMQGFSLGGELGTAASLLMEAGTVKGRGARVSWLAASQGIAAVLGALSGAILYSSLSQEALEVWGWRIPFLLGLIIAPVGLYIRSQLDETLAPEAHEALPIVTLFSQHGAKVVQGVFAIAALTVGLYVVVFYMPTYMVRVLGLPASLSLMAGCVGGLTMAVFSLISGRLTDSLVRRKPLIFWSQLVTTAAIYPAFWMMTTYPSVPMVLSMAALLTALLYVVITPLCVMLLEIFPANVRATGLATIFSIAVMVFGGSSQVIVTWLLAKTGSAMAPAFYLLACCVLTLLAVAAINEPRRQSEPVRLRQTVIE